MKARPDLATKPYYQCLFCPDFRKVCGGIPTREMDLPTWCEYIRIVMDFFHLTNAYVAPEADVSMKTMERISAGKIEDIRRATARRVELVVIGPVGVHRCSRKDGIEQAEQIKKLTEKIEELEAENKRKAKIIDRFLEGPSGA